MGGRRASQWHKGRMTRLATALALLACMLPAWAQQQFPSRAIRFAVAFSPGGIADVDVPSWYTLLLPARAAREAVERLRSELKRIAGNADFIEQLARQAIDVQALAPGEYAPFLRAEIQKWAHVVQANGIKAE